MEVYKLPVGTKLKALHGSAFAGCTGTVTRKADRIVTVLWVGAVGGNTSWNYSKGETYSCYKSLGLSPLGKVTEGMVL